MKILTILDFINRRLGMIAAVLAVVGIVLMVYGTPVASQTVDTGSSAMTAVSQGEPIIKTKEVSQGFTLSGNTDQIITVSPNGIVSVTSKSKSTSTTSTTTTSSTSQTTPTQPTDPDSTNQTPAPTQTQPVPVDPEPIDPKAPVCAPCGGGGGVNTLKPDHIECPMICMQ